MRTTKIISFLLILFVGITVLSQWNDISKVFTTVGTKIESFIKNGPQLAHLPSLEELLKNTKEGTALTPGPLEYKKNNSTEAVLTQSGVLTLTNEARKAEGLPPLAGNSKLDASAKLKMEDMFNLQYFEHTSPTGKKVSDNVMAVGYDYIIIGENLALGQFENDKDLVDAWMASPGHRANILNSRYSDIGIALGKGIYEGNEVWIAVQHFGLPRSACPDVDSMLKVTIETQELELDAMKTTLEAKQAYINEHTSESGSPSYNEKITEYNALVEEYNILLKKTKSDIDLYNSQVEAFNACAQA